MSSHVEKIKEKLTVVDVLSSYIKMEKAGANYKARCPFHHEKTPSFFISPGRNSYYCFGCGVKGDIFTFVQEFEGVDFMGALKVLASRAGVELVKEDPRAKTERERLFLCLEYAAVFFQKNLWEQAEQKSVLEYIRGRGLTDEMAKDWKVGYSLDDWRTLLTFLKAKKFTEADIEKVGLIKKKDGAEGNAPNDYYDRFRGRIMFPIFDSSGRVIGFSGRIFKGDEKSAKYLNSPETPLFLKSQVLYGIHKAKNALREQDSAILVEGQMDLLMSHQAGFENTVATSGTALTDSHLIYIRRFTNNVIMAFDPDAAGVNAALRGAKMALGLGLEVKIAALPTGEDPADCIKAHPDVWKKAVENGVHIIDFLLNTIEKKADDNRKRFQDIRMLVLPLIAELPGAMEQAHYVNAIAGRFGVKEDAVWDDLKKIKPQGEAMTSANLSISNVQAGGEVSMSRMNQRKNVVQQKLFGVLFWLQSTEKQGAKETEEKLKKLLKEEYDTVHNFFSNEKEGLILEADIMYGQSKRLGDDIRELMANLERDMLKDELSKTLVRLQEAERKKDMELAQKILEECKGLSERIAKLPPS